MMLIRPVTALVGCVVVSVGVACLVAPGSAQQPRQIRLTVESADQYSRIVATWADGSQRAPQLDAEIKGRVLVIRSPQPVSIDTAAVVAGLTGLVTQGRAESDGKGARFALTRGMRVYISTSIDRTAIDLVDENSRFRSPPVVSPLVAERARKTKKKPTSLSRIDVDVKASTLDGTTRVAFYWQEVVNYAARLSGQRLTLTFSAYADPDIARIRLSMPPGLASIDADNTASGLVVALGARSGYRISHSSQNAIVVVSLIKDTDQTETSVSDDKTLRSTRAPPADRTPISGPRAPRTTWLRGGWPSPVPGSGVVPVEVRPVSGGTELTLMWDTPVPAAIFTRAGVVWAVFGASASVNVDQSALPAGVTVMSVEAEQASVLRMRAPDGVVVSAMQNGPDWTIRLLPSYVPAWRRLSPRRLVSDTGRPSIHTLLPGAAGLVWFRDPVVGDLLAAAVAFGPTSALGLGQTLVEADLLTSAHGMGIVPRADDVSVSVAGETVIISTPVGLSVSADDPGTLAKVGRGESYIDLAAWGGLSGEDFFARRSELEQRLSAADGTGRQGESAFLDLARFYVGHDLGVEALGVLHLAVAQRPLIKKDARVLALRAVASIMAGRNGESEALLTHGALAADRTVALWRGLAAAGEEKWRRAHDLFATGEELLPTLAPRWGAAIHAAAAEAAYHVRDYERARRYAQLASASGYSDPFERAALVLARLAGIEGDQPQAYERLGEVAQMTSDPTAVDAELERLELGSELKVVSARQITERLEALRFRWRGDQREARIVQALTDQYMALGRYRDALATAQAVNVHNPEGPGARALRLSMSDYFRRLFLGDEASRLDPIRALALFYEFRSLTPIGADGDRMVRKLAQRLVSFDLLDQAAELLQHQIDNRLRGPGRASIAAELGLIYLMNRQYARALSVIGATRSAGGSEQLIASRRLIEARALVGLERYDHAVELLESAEGFDASWVRSEALWRDGKWRGAARALMECARTFIPGRVSGNSLSDIAMRAAVAARMASDAEVLEALRRQYIPLFDGTEKARSFDLLTAQTDATGVGLAEAVRILSDMARVEAFADSIGVEPPLSDEDPA